ncbi:MAG: hypothetical protein WDZ83_18650 [Rhizobiaceae bacterium]
MPRHAHNRQNRDEVAGELLRLAASAGNRRSLQALPQFTLNLRLSAEMTQLLARLDRAETAGGR